LAKTKDKTKARREEAKKARMNFSPVASIKPMPKITKNKKNASVRLSATSQKSQFFFFDQRKRIKSRKTTIPKKEKPGSALRENHFKG